MLTLHFVFFGFNLAHLLLSFLFATLLSAFLISLARFVQYISMHVLLFATAFCVGYTHLRKLAEKVKVSNCFFRSILSINQKAITLLNGKRKK